MYKLTVNDNILRIKDGSIIPKDAENRDYAEYLKWLDGGNIPAAADPLPKVYPQFSAGQFFNLFTEAEQIAVKAATRQSDNVGLWYDKMMMADYITLEDPATDKGLSALEDAGLLSPARVVEIKAVMESN